MRSRLSAAWLRVASARTAGRGAYSSPLSACSRELRCIEVIKGSLPDPSRNAYLEFSWPIDVGVDELVNVTPVAARVIVLGYHVNGALEDAQTFNAEQGIDTTATVKPNLLEPLFFGLLIEGVDGQTHARLWDPAPVTTRGAEALANFEDAMAAIRAAVQK